MILVRNGVVVVWGSICKNAFFVCKGNVKLLRSRSKRILSVRYLKVIDKRSQKNMYNIFLFKSINGLELNV